MAEAETAVHELDGQQLANTQLHIEPKVASQLGSNVPDELDVALGTALREALDNELGRERFREVRQSVESIIVPHRGAERRIVQDGHHALRTSVCLLYTSPSPRDAHES
eukprot:253745-Prymnesium_polylepis.1